MEHISTLLKEKKISKGWSNREIAQKTYIDETTVSKHLNGKREVSPYDLKQYCKCFGMDYDEVRTKYDLNAIDVCKKGTLKNIIATVSALGVGSLTYVGVKKLIDEKCKRS